MSYPHLAKIVSRSLLLASIVLATVHSSVAVANLPVQATSKPKVVCLGDSITNRGFPKVLEKLLDVEAINAGVGGHSSAQGLRRISKDVLAHNPDIVVVFFGTNDSRVDSTRAHVPPRQYAANLQTIIDRCAQQDIRAVLCTLPPINHETYFTRHRKSDFDAVGGLAKLLSQYRDAALSVAKSNHVPVVDLNQLLLKQPEWMSKDGVHPTEAGTTIIGTHIADAMRPLLSVVGKTYNVASADEFETLVESKQLSAGDTIVWANGTYRDVEVNIDGINGTKVAPITLRAETSGKVIFRGESQFRIGAQQWTIRGFHFDGGTSELNSYNSFQFRGNSGTEAQHVRFTNCAMTNLMTEDETSKWVQLYGRFNQIDHCHFSGKNKKGALITVELGYLAADSTAEHVIEHNYFGDVAFQDGGDNETIRIGYSGDQNKSAKCVVQHNLFVRCNGENEIISNKSSHNTYASNTFRQCNGALVLRHGHHAVVTGNYFFGEGATDAGGIRVSDSHHTIVNNYFQDLTGTTWNAAFSVLGGKATSGGTSSGYQAVDNITVAHNTLINCSRSLYFSKAKGKRPPTGIVANNLVSSQYGPLVTADIPTDKLTWTGNLLHGAPVGISIDHINTDPGFATAAGLQRPNPTGPAANTASKGQTAINHDIDNQSRANATSDIGADEVSGAMGLRTSKPLTPKDVGVNYLSIKQSKAK